MEVESALLGLADAPLPCPCGDPFVNRAGGQSVWLDAVKRGNPVCRLCANGTRLVVQIYCPISDAGQHRVLYVFVCVSCCESDGGWTVLCQQKRAENLVAQQIEANPGETSAAANRKSAKVTNSTVEWGASEGQDDWGVGEDDWGDAADDQWGETPGAEDKNSSELDNAVCRDQSGTPLDASYPANDNASREMASCSVIESAGEVDINCIVAGLSLEDSTVSVLAPEAKCLNNRGGLGTACLIENITRDNSGKNDTGTVEPCVRNNGPSLPCENSSVAAPSVVRSDVADGETASGADNETDNIADEFGAFYVNVVSADELAKESVSYGHVTKLMKTYSQQEGISMEELTRGCVGDDDTGGGRGGKESYEKTTVTHGSKLVYKFCKRLSVCPEQIIRYQLYGEPLLLQDLSNGPLSNACSRCAGELVYEMQLMPHLFDFLAQAEGNPDLFGACRSVIIYTCRNACHSDDGSAVEEHAVVQLDADWMNVTKKFKD